jgi:hypothetical protein
VQDVSSTEAGQPYDHTHRYGFFHLQNMDTVLGSFHADWLDAKSSSGDSKNSVSLALAERN